MTKTLLTLVLLFAPLCGAARAEAVEVHAHAIPDTPLKISLPATWEAMPPALMPVLEKVIASRTRDGITAKFKPVAFFTKGPFAQVNPFYGPSALFFVARDFVSLDDTLQSGPTYMNSLFGTLAGKNRGLYSRVHAGTVTWEDVGGLRVVGAATTVEGKQIQIVGRWFFTRDTIVCVVIFSGIDDADGVLAESEAALAKVELAPDQRISTEEMARAKKIFAGLQIPFAKTNFPLFCQEASEDAKNQDFVAASKAWDDAAGVCEEILHRISESDSGPWRQRWASTLISKATMFIDAKRDADAGPVLATVRERFDRFEPEATRDEKWRVVFDDLIQKEMTLARNAKDGPRLRGLAEHWITLWKDAFARPGLPEDFRRPAAHVPFLLADDLRTSKFPAEALITATTGVSALKGGLNEQSHDVSYIELVSGISRQSRSLVELQRPAEAVAIAREGVELCEAFMPRAPQRFKMTAARAHANLAQSLATKPTDPGAAEAVLSWRKACGLVEELKAANLATESGVKEAASWKMMADRFDKKTP